MPGLLEAVIARPPAMFVIQTRGPLVLRDLELLQKIPNLRVSFSITTDREDVRKLYEPHCAEIAERWRTVHSLREAGVTVHATLAPLLPCNPESLMAAALKATTGAVIADPLHTRANKARGATTREAALHISEKHGYTQWHEAEFQSLVVDRMSALADCTGRQFGIGPKAFGWLACDP